jgi:hypothetical protein
VLIGTHILFYSTDAEADRAFFRDVLGFRAVDAGRGWLIFAVPPAEAAFHPADGQSRRGRARRRRMRAEVYLMCDDLRALVRSLRTKKVRCGAVEELSWGVRTSLPLPSGAYIGLYQPKHLTALKLRSR